MSCILPYKQMVIRPDGKLSLCCNDALGKFTLGDLTTQSIVEAWNSEEYCKLRDRLVKGRKEVALCKYCDNLQAANGY